MTSIIFEEPMSKWRNMNEKSETVKAELSVFSARQAISSGAIQSTARTNKFLNIPHGKTSCVGNFESEMCWFIDENRPSETIAHERAGCQAATVTQF